jgi:hypothetical protein
MDNPIGKNQKMERGRNAKIFNMNKKEIFIADDILNDHFKKHLSGKCLSRWIDKPIHLCTKEQLMAIIDIQGKSNYTENKNKGTT